ncbi:MAG TPA: hypothetical protein PL009_01755 [Flavipsychrobacter sp.]|nr:hypothetical protein [Flavipsychrobacter sp.]
MLRKFLKLSPLLVVVLLPFASFAQQTISFGPEEENTSFNKRRKQKKEVYKNSVTLGIVSAINGYTPVYYERALTSFLSVQVGAGITYRSFGNDFGQIIWNDGKNSELVENGVAGMQDVDDQYYHYKHRKAALGSYFSVAPKIYFSDNVMDGFYLAPTVEWKMYRFNAQMANTNKSLEEIQNSYSYFSFDSDDRNIPKTSNKLAESMNCLDISLMVGGHYQRANRLTIGWNISLGLRKANSKRLDIYTVDDANGKSYFRNNVRTYDSMKPLISANLVLGGVF